MLSPSTVKTNNITTMVFSSPLAANSKVEMENTYVLVHLGVSDVGLACGVGKIGPLGPLPLAQSAVRSMDITARAT